MSLYSSTIDYGEASVVFILHKVDHTHTLWRPRMDIILLQTTSLDVTQ